jgi:glycosyltransferase involved in cell wall biosynthesis
VTDEVSPLRPWRIAHLTTADISLALLLATELEERVSEGHTVLGISAPGSYVERVEALGVEHVSVPELTRSWNVRQDLRAFAALWRTLKRLDLDVLHTHNPKTGVMGRIAGRLAGVPVVVNTCHGLWATPEDPLPKRLFVYGLEGLAARFSHYELFQNAQDERTMRWALRRGRHRVVGNGIDLERFRFDPEGRARLRAEWGVGDDEVLVGTVGRRVAEKGMAEYAVAASALKDRAHFVWVGPADDSVRDHEVDTTDIRFIDEQTDMPAVYSAFDVFVLASYREGFSRAAMEAAACGRPLILTDIRGCREIGTHEVHLLLVRPRDAGALTSAVDRLLNEPRTRAHLARAARDRAASEFDQRAVARASLHTYASELARGLPSARVP